MDFPYRDSEGTVADRSYHPANCPRTCGQTQETIVQRSSRTGESTTCDQITEWRNKYIIDLITGISHNLSGQ